MKQGDKNSLERSHLPPGKIKNLDLLKTNPAKKKFKKEYFRMTNKFPFLNERRDWFLTKIYLVYASSCSDEPDKFPQNLFQRNFLQKLPVEAFSDISSNLRCKIPFTTTKVRNEKQIKIIDRVKATFMSISNPI
jgi:hypothetical protein